MSLNILNPVILKKIKPKGGFCAVNPADIDNNLFVRVSHDFGLEMDAWDRLSDYPVDVYFNDGFVYGDGYYVIGGADYSGNGSSSIFFYNITNDTWTNIGSYDTPIHSHTVTHASDGRVYIIGGFNGSPLNTVKSASVNDLLTWTDLSPIPGSKVRHRHSAFEYNGKIYIYGGYSDSSWNNPTTFRYDIDVYDISSDTWTTGVGYNNSFFVNEAIAIGNLMYVPSFLNDPSDTVMDVRVFNLDTYQWYVINPNSSKPSARYLHSLITHGDNLYIFGGKDRFNNTLSEAWVFNTNTRIWNPLIWDTSKQSSLFPKAVIKDDVIYTREGLSSSQHWSYDISKSVNMAIRIAEVS